MTSVIGDASQVVFFPRRFSPWLGYAMEAQELDRARMSAYEYKAKILVHVLAARSMVARSLLTCLSSLYDVRPKLVPGIGRYRRTTHLIRRRARLHRSSGMPAKFACSFVYLLPYMHEDVRVEGGSTRMETSSTIDGGTITAVCRQVMMFTRDLH